MSSLTHSAYKAAVSVSHSRICHRISSHNMGSHIYALCVCACMCVTRQTDMHTTSISLDHLIQSLTHGWRTAFHGSLAWRKHWISCVQLILDFGKYIQLMHMVTERTECSYICVCVCVSIISIRPFVLHYNLFSFFFSHRDNPEHLSVNVSQWCSFFEHAI